MAKQTASRCDELVAKIVQCGLGVRKTLCMNELAIKAKAMTCKLLILCVLQAWLLSLDSNQEPSG
jgi:hypothetical protein